MGVEREKYFRINPSIHDILSCAVEEGVPGTKALKVVVLWFMAAVRRTSHTTFYTLNHFRIMSTVRVGDFFDFRPTAATTTEPPYLGIPPSPWWSCPLR